MKTFNILMAISAMLAFYAIYRWDNWLIAIVCAHVFAVVMITGWYVRATKKPDNYDYKQMGEKA